MTVYYSDDLVTLHHGDCLDVLRALPDASVDAVVTDPPYSLTDRREQYCAGDVLRDAIVSDAQHADAERAKSLITLRITVAPALAMRVRGVDLDGEVSTRQEEVDDDGAPGRQNDDVLVNEGHTVTGEERLGGTFRLWVRQGATRCIGACRCLGQHGDGLIRVPVRLRHDALGQSERSPGVMALGGAELAAVLALDVARLTGELLPASGADALDPAFELLCPEGVGALAGASGLTSVAESSGVGSVDGPADRALSFDLMAHRAVLSWRPTVLRGFMSSLWDGTGVETDTRLWRECLRVLKPGGHCLAFGSPRTWHNLQTAIEKSGFEIRDGIAWLTGSGFPKSLDVSKAIDKDNGRKFEDRFALGRHIRERREELGHTRAEVNRWLGAATKCEHYESDSPGFARVPTLADWHVLRERLGLSDEHLPLVERVEAERAVIGSGKSGAASVAFIRDEACEYDITAPATPDAERWQGWGTALKPAFEPIVVARKPLSGTVAQTVLEHGTGALNIDACRVSRPDDEPRSGFETHPGRKSRGGIMNKIDELQGTYDPNPAGRWPTNVVLDDTQAAVLDEMSGERGGGFGTRGASTEIYGGGKGFTEATGETVGYGDSGGASRFFPTFRYEAKAPTSERPKVNGTAHPTVKPLDLMRWLVRLVTPPGGTVLEPFAGSGTTVEACVIEGFRCIAIEKTEEYLPLTVARINRQRNPVEAIRQAGDDLGLFEGLEGMGA